MSPAPDKYSKISNTIFSDFFFFSLLPEKCGGDAGAVGGSAVRGRGGWPAARDHPIRWVLVFFFLLLGPFLLFLGLSYCLRSIRYLFDCLSVCQFVFMYAFLSVYILVCLSATPPSLSLLFSLPPSLSLPPPSHPPPQPHPQRRATRPWLRVSASCGGRSAEWSTALCSQLEARSSPWSVARRWLVCLSTQLSFRP